MKKTNTMGAWRSSQNTHLVANKGENNLLVYTFSGIRGGLGNEFSKPPIKHLECGPRVFLAWAVFVIISRGEIIVRSFHSTTDEF